MQILTVEEIREAESIAVEKGTTFDELMEKAGAGIASNLDELSEEMKIPKKVIFLCGKGNNTGDAFVAARILSDKGWKVEYVMLLQGELSKLSKEKYNLLPKKVRKVPKERLRYGVGFFVDAVFGIGYCGELSQSLQDDFYSMSKNEGKHLCVAIDIPSGLNADTGEISQGTFKADYTFTLGALKLAFSKKDTKFVTGEIKYLDIGFSKIKKGK